MKILILNWRSLKDPLSGGAEVATFEHAKRWVSQHNADVIWVSPPYKNDIKKETIEGIKFHYIGKPLNRNLSSLIVSFPYFYLLVAITYLKQFRGKIDVVIDQVHGIPYLTPLYVKENIYVHVNEIAGDIWNKMYPFPFNLIGRYIEKIIFIPYIWKNIKFISISESTTKDLLKVGIKKENIALVNCGINVPILEEMPEKEEQFTIIYLNRLVKMKGIERALDIIAEVRKQIPDLKFWIVGRGTDEYTEFLKQKTKDLNIDSCTRFFGFVSEEEKIDLLSRAHVLINTSYKEGWGLVNIEANARWTPSVAFDVDGNRESIKDGVSGYIAANNDNNEFATRILATNKNMAIRNSAQTFSKYFDWDVLSDQYYSVLET